MSLLIITEIFYITITSWALTCALQHWLIYEHPIMKRAVLFLMLPSYILILQIGILQLLLPMTQMTIFFVHDIALAVFIYTGILSSIFIHLLESSKQNNIMKLVN